MPINNNKTRTVRTAIHGPKGRHVIGILLDKHRVLGPKEQSPQKITILRL
jgi:hypothetical protein